MVPAVIPIVSIMTGIVMGSTISMALMMTALMMVSLVVVSFVGLIVGLIVGPIIGRVIIIIRVGLTIPVSVDSVRAVSIVVICGPMASVGIPEPEKVAADVEIDAGASEGMRTGAKNK